MVELQQLNENPFDGNKSSNQREIPCIDSGEDPGNFSLTQKCSALFHNSSVDCTPDCTVIAGVACMVVQ